MPQTTFRKWKTVLPSLNLEFLFCGIVYKIECPHCEVSYVGITSRCLLSRFREHKTYSGPEKKHFALSTKRKLRLVIDMEILASTRRSDIHLLGLEALFIREVKPFLNTQNNKEQEC